MSDERERMQLWPVAIWTDSQWLVADRSKWPSGGTAHVIVECEPALGVLNVGRVVLGAEAHDELERARGGDFGEDPRPAWLVIGIRADLSKANRKRKLDKSSTHGELVDALEQSMGIERCSRKHPRCSSCAGCETTWKDYPVARDCKPCTCKPLEHSCDFGGEDRTCYACAIERARRPK